MITMNRKQLQAILYYLNAPKVAYDLGNNMRADACDAIERTWRGWEVYTTERGDKYDIRVLRTETDACLELLYRIVHFSNVDKTLPSLSLHQLHPILVYLQVPEALYDFSGQMRSANYFSIECTAQGWEVFFAANGEKRNTAVFDNETDACLDLLYKVMHL